MKKQTIKTAIAVAIAAVMGGGQALPRLPLNQGRRMMVLFFKTEMYFKALAQRM